MYPEIRNPREAPNVRSRANTASGCNRFGRSFELELFYPLTHAGHLLEKLVELGCSRGGCHCLLPWLRGDFEVCLGFGLSGSGCGGLLFRFRGHLDLEVRLFFILTGSRCGLVLLWFRRNLRPRLG
jgi:hypothetical protein